MKGNVLGILPASSLLGQAGAGAELPVHRIGHRLLLDRVLGRVVLALVHPLRGVSVFLVIQLNLVFVFDSAMRAARAHKLDTFLVILGLKT